MSRQKRKREREKSRTYAPACTCTTTASIAQLVPIRHPRAGYSQCSVRGWPVRISSHSNLLPLLFLLPRTRHNTRRDLPSRKTNVVTTHKHRYIFLEISASFHSFQVLHIRPSGVAKNYNLFQSGSSFSHNIIASGQVSYSIK